MGFDSDCAPVASINIIVLAHSDVRLFAMYYYAAGGISIFVLLSVVDSGRVYKYTYDDNDWIPVNTNYGRTLFGSNQSRPFFSNLVLIAPTKSANWKPYSVVLRV